MRISINRYWPLILNTLIQEATEEYKRCVLGIARCGIRLGAPGSMLRPLILAGPCTTEYNNYILHARQYNSEESAQPAVLTACERINRNILGLIFNNVYLFIYLFIFVNTASSARTLKD
jgi:hypothetical protein